MSCSACGAFFYCARRCLERHWVAQRHSSDCERHAKQVARAEELRRAHDMRWLAGPGPGPGWLDLATVGIDDGFATRCDVLERCGVHHRGPFRRECDCHRRTQFGALPRDDGWCRERRRADGNGDGDGPLPAFDPDRDVATWKELYAALRVRDGDCAAIVWSTGATVYSALCAAGRASDARSGVVV